MSSPLPPPRKKVRFLSPCDGDDDNKEDKECTRAKSARAENLLWRTRFENLKQLILDLRDTCPEEQEMILLYVTRLQESVDAVLSE